MSLLCTQVSGKTVFIEYNVQTLYFIKKKALIVFHINKTTRE